MKISVLIPALNEAESIGTVVASMPRTAISGCILTECLVIDNGSTDGTAATAAAAGARVIHSPRGYGAAMLAGLAATSPDSDIIVCMDGDGSDCIEQLDRLIAPIARNEADFVIGSRLRGQREPGSMLPTQIFAGRLVGALVRLVYDFRYTDMGPFRAIRRDALLAMNMRERTYGWNLEMQIKAITHSLRILEVPVDYRRRLAGVSKVAGNFKASIVAGYRIFGVFLRVRRHP